MSHSNLIYGIFIKDNFIYMEIFTSKYVFRNFFYVTEFRKRASQMYEMNGNNKMWIVTFAGQEVSMNRLTDEKIAMNF